MVKRGRKSAETLQLLASVGVGQRLKPSPYLRAEERQIFADLVETRSADYFKEEHRPFLDEYVRQVRQCKFIDAQTERARQALSGRVVKASAAEDFARWVRTREVASRTLTKLGRALRIPPSATYFDKKRTGHGVLDAQAGRVAASTQAPAKKLWDR